MGSTVKFNHNKKRNSGLIYEFLTRKISECVLDGNRSGYADALDILKRYYSPGQPIEIEHRLFNPIISTRGVRKSIARGTIEEIKRSASRLDFKLIDIKKSNLIKEIHKKFGKGFFSSFKLDDYKAFASTQLLINGCNPNRTIDEGVQRVQLEESLMSFMMSDPGGAENEEHDDLVYSIAVKKFNERYMGVLNEDQKKILGGYVSAISSGDTKKEKRFLSLLAKKRVDILGSLKEALTMKEVVEDEEMGKKLVEARDKLRSFSFSELSEAETEEMMLFCKLVQEIKSDE